jgi:hypothetical protein
MTFILLNTTVCSMEAKYFPLSEIANISKAKLSRFTAHNYDGCSISVKCAQVLRRQVPHGPAQRVRLDSERHRGQRVSRNQRNQEEELGAAPPYGYQKRKMSKHFNQSACNKKITFQKARANK